MLLYIILILIKLIFSFGIAISQKASVIGKYKHENNFAGTLNGSLSSLKAHELGSAAITGALIRSNVRPEEVSDVLLGQVCKFGIKSSIPF